MVPTRRQQVITLCAWRFVIIHSHLATESDRHYATLSLCLRRHLWLIGYYVMLSFLVSCHCALKQLNDGRKAE